MLRFIAIFGLFIGLSGGMSSAVAATDLDEIKATKVRIRNSAGRIVDRTVACQEEIPGELKTTGFVPISDTLRRLRRQGSAGIIRLREYLRINRAAVSKCKSLRGTLTVSEQIDKSISAMSGIVLGTEVTALLSEINTTSKLRAGVSSTVSDILDLLDDAINCSGASVSRTGTLITIDLGSSCSINDRVFSGEFTAEISLSSTSLSVGLTFSELNSENITVTGTSTITVRSTGTTVSLDLSLIYQSVTYNITFTGTVTTDSTGVVIDGSGSIGSSELDADITLTELHKDYGEGCYPDSGEIILEIEGIPSTTLTFNGDGTVTVKVGSLPSSEEELPGCGE